MYPNRPSSRTRSNKSNRTGSNINVLQTDPVSGPSLKITPKEVGTVKEVDSDDKNKSSITPEESL